MKNKHHVVVTWSFLPFAVNMVLIFLFSETNNLLMVANASITSFLFLEFSEVQSLRKAEELSEFYLSRYLRQR